MSDFLVLAESAVLKQVSQSNGLDGMACDFSRGSEELHG